MHIDHSAQGLRKRRSSHGFSSSDRGEPAQQSQIDRPKDTARPGEIMHALKHGNRSRKLTLLREESCAFEDRLRKWMAIGDAQDDVEEMSGTGEIDENAPSEANFDETVSIVEAQEAIRLMANSGALSGLDKGAAQPREDSTPEPGKAQGSASESGNPKQETPDSSGIHRLRRETAVPQGRAQGAPTFRLHAAAASTGTPP